MPDSYKRQKGIKITKVFQEILEESGHKPKKVWVDKGSELQNRSVKSWLHSNNIEIYSTHNEKKSVVA